MAKKRKSPGITIYLRDLRAKHVVPHILNRFGSKTCGCMHGSKTCGCMHKREDGRIFEWGKSQVENMGITHERE